MDFKTSIKTCFKKYGNFSGRATRSEFWFFYLFFFIVYIASMILMFGISFHFMWLWTVFVFGMIVPSFAVTARRLHDVNKSGWLQLLPMPTALLMDLLERTQEFSSLLFAIITLGLYLYLFVQYVSHGDKKDNKFGKNPYKKRKIR